MTRKSPTSHAARGRASGTRSLRLPGSVLAGLGLLSGCAALNARPPVEAFAEKLADQVIIPAVREGLSGGAQQLGMQASAQGINPTYVVKFRGVWITGLEGEASVGIEGLAGQVQISSSAARAAQPGAASEGGAQ